MMSVAPTEFGMDAKVHIAPNNIQQCPPTQTPSKNKSKELVSSKDILDEIDNDYQLNKKQWVTFHIIAHKFIREYIFKVDTKSKSLHMFMTGPGGTGKMYVLKAVQKVMEHYGGAHRIRFLAPTGLVASLIGRMTINKGLGIKIKSTDKGKWNRKLGDQHEDYSIIISVQNRTHLWIEWQFVDIVMIDECS